MNKAKVLYLHPKGLHSCGHLSAYSPQSHNCQGLSLKLHAHVSLAVPAPRLEGGVTLRNVPEECNLCSLQFMHPSNRQLPSNGTDEGTGVLGSTDGVTSWSAGGVNDILTLDECLALWASRSEPTGKRTREQGRENASVRGKCINIGKSAFV